VCRPVRVLLVSQHFAPERTAAPLRLRPLMRELVERGHEVEVLCAVPNHPEGVVHPGYGGPVVRRRMDGFDITHVWVRPTQSSRPRRRMLTFATFAASGLLFGSLARRPSVIFASSPPLSVGVLAAALARRFRVRWALDVRDLWIEAAGSLGVVDTGGVIDRAKRLEAWLYRDAAAITAPTEAFRKHLAANGVDRDKLYLLPNGASEECLAVRSKRFDRSAFELPEDRFVWTFAGNVGLSQGLDTAVEAAGLLGPGFQLLILGDGASRPRLEEAAAELPPGSVVFRGPVDPLRAAEHMRASDALLVSLADDPTAARTIPVKLYDSCAVGRPVVVAAPGESSRLAEELNVGVAVEPGDAQALARAVRALSEDPELAERVARDAYDFASIQRREWYVDGLERMLAGIAR
jgi:glycosyltransferase involved in cell wall biosynthesis